MHALTIARRNSAMDWKFLFKTAEGAEHAFASLTPAPHAHQLAAPPDVTIRDDFGQRGKFNPADVTGVLWEDLDESRVAHIEHALHDMRTRATIQTRMQSDPALRVASMNGPAVLQPMPRPMM